MASTSFMIERYPTRREMVKRQSTILTLSLLEQISCSVSSFKPSSSLAELALLQKEKYKSEANPIAEIDVVISGGGMKGYFMVGAVYILAKEMIKNNVKIARCSGTSAGSWGGMFLLLYIYAGFDNYFWLETYHQAHEQQGVPLLDVYWKYYMEVLRDNPNLFPPDAYKICSGRLFISITVLTRSGPKLKIISEFESNDDLVACCSASSSIPYLTQSTALRIYRGEYVCDGGIFNNTPVFPDGIRRQLVFRLTDVEYPFRMMTNPLGNYYNPLYNIIMIHRIIMLCYILVWCCVLLWIYCRYLYRYACVARCFDYAAFLARGTSRFYCLVGCQEIQN